MSLRTKLWFLSVSCAAALASPALAQCPDAELFAADATLTLPAGSEPGLAGATAFHAYVVLDPSGSALIGATSNATAVDLL